MDSRSHFKTPVAIIGGGLSGLSLAFELHTRDVPFVLYESSDHLGGALRTRRELGYLVEQGPNGFLNNAPATLDLIRRLGIEHEVQQARTDAKIRYIFSGDRLHKVPTSPGALLTSDLLPLSSKFRILTEAFRTHTLAPDDETIFSFLERHFDKAVAAELAGPFTIGVFAGDASRLSIHECFSSLAALERSHGSLIKGMMKSSSRPRLSSLKNGMQSLVLRIHELLPEGTVQMQTPVLGARPQESEWMVTTAAGTKRHSLIVFACPSAALAGLGSEWLPSDILHGLSSFQAAPVRTLSIAFQARTSFRGFGTLIKQESSAPDPQRPTLLGFLHPPDIFPDRAPEGSDLITTLWGGTWQTPALQIPERELVAIARQELERVLGEPLPSIQKTWDWFHSPGIPQYDVSALRLLNQMRNLNQVVPGAFIHSNLVGGVSMNDCITKSVALSNQITMLYNKRETRAE